MVTMSEAGSVRRVRQSQEDTVRQLAGENPAPCFVLKLEGNHVNEPVEDTIRDLVARTEGAKRTSQDIQIFIRTRMPFSRTDIPIKVHIVPEEDFAVTEEKRTFSKHNPLPALKSHYSILLSLVSYIQYARTNDKVSKQPGTNTLKDKLKDIENELYQIMCDIKIALLGQGEDTLNDTTGLQVSSAFRGAASSLFKETKRAYVLLNDCESVMVFLNEMYTGMN